MGPELITAMPPAQARTRERMQVVVAGVAGGVGTTTVAALLSSSLGTPAGAPHPLDHSGGSLAARLDPAVLARSSGELLTVHDLGATLYSNGINALLDRSTVAVLVAAATPAGLRDAAVALARIRSAAGQSAARPVRPVLVAVQLTGARPPHARLAGLASEQRGLAAVGVLPYDRALLSGGPAHFDALTARSKLAISAFTTAVRVQLPGLPQSGRRSRSS